MMTNTTTRGNREPLSSLVTPLIDWTCVRSKPETAGSGSGNIRLVSTPSPWSSPTSASLRLRPSRPRRPLETVQEKTAWILENHHPEPLEEARQVELKRILEAADQEIG